MRQGASTHQFSLTLIASVVLSYFGLILYNVLGGASLDANKIGFEGWGNWETGIGFCLLVVGLYVYRSVQEPGCEYETDVQSPPNSPA